MTLRTEKQSCLLCDLINKVVSKIIWSDYIFVQKNNMESPKTWTIILGTMEGWKESCPSNNWAVLPLGIYHIKGEVIFQVSIHRFHFLICLTLYHFTPDYLNCGPPGSKWCKGKNIIQQLYTVYLSLPHIYLGKKSFFFFQFMPIFVAMLEKIVEKDGHGNINTSSWFLA